MNLHRPTGIYPPQTIPAPTGIMADDEGYATVWRKIEAGIDNHNTCPCGMDAHNDTLCEDCREERQHMKVTTVNARVMKSFNYCHFEIAVTAEVGDDSPEFVGNHLQIYCAKLVDRAIDRYKAYKAHQEVIDRMKYDSEVAITRLENLKKMRERGDELTIEGAAILRAYDLDPGYVQKLKGLPFDYDDWEDAHSDRYDGPFLPLQKVAVDESLEEKNAQKEPREQPHTADW